MGPMSWPGSSCCHSSVPSFALSPDAVAEFDTHVPRCLGPADEQSVVLLILVGEHVKRAHPRARAI